MTQAVYIVVDFTCSVSKTAYTLCNVPWCSLIFWYVYVLL